MTIALVEKTLADFPAITYARCSNCCEDLPKSSQAEQFENWIVVLCPSCALYTPIRLEPNA